MGKSNSQIKMLAENKRARFDYQVEDRLECGIELKGTEVKSVKSGRFSFSDSYARIKEGELWLIGLHIPPYPQGNIFNHEPDRDRKLLVHKQEIKRLKRKVEEKGVTLVPLKLYTKRGLVKVDLGLCRGKRKYDKREDIKRRDLDREQERAIKERF
ncbi:MAG: SsrA-binding protein [Spirochaetes bacterium]|nr:MAG: SsrA-binding protein [Spirochaetota bacterium]